MDASHYLFHRFDMAADFEETYPVFFQADFPTDRSEISELLKGVPIHLWKWKTGGFSIHKKPTSDLGSLQRKALVPTLKPKVSAIFPTLQIFRYWKLIVYFNHLTSALAGHLEEVERFNKLTLQDFYDCDSSSQVRRLVGNDQGPPLEKKKRSNADKEKSTTKKVHNTRFQ
jgi:hypothetical protein